jgi:hypothetical protein
MPSIAESNHRTTSRSIIKDQKGLKVVKVIDLIRAGRGRKVSDEIFN